MLRKHQAGVFDLEPKETLSQNRKGTTSNHSCSSADSKWEGFNEGLWLGEPSFGRFFHKCLNMVTHTQSKTQENFKTPIRTHLKSFKGLKNDTWFDIIASPKGQRRSWKRSPYSKGYGNKIGVDHRFGYSKVWQTSDTEVTTSLTACLKGWPGDVWFEEISKNGSSDAHSKRMHICRIVHTWNSFVII